MQVALYNPRYLDAVVCLSLRAWAPVVDSIQNAMDAEVYQMFYSDSWRVSQQKAVEKVCAAEDTNDSNMAVNSQKVAENRQLLD